MNQVILASLASSLSPLSAVELGIVVALLALDPIPSRVQKFAHCVDEVRAVAALYPKLDAVDVPAA